MPLNVPWIVSNTVSSVPNAGSKGATPIAANPGVDALKLTDCRIMSARAHGAAKHNTTAQAMRANEKRQRVALVPGINGPAT